MCGLRGLARAGPSCAVRGRARGPGAERVEAGTGDRRGRAGRGVSGGSGGRAGRARGLMSSPLGPQHLHRAAAPSFLQGRGRRAV